MRLDVFLVGAGLVKSRTEAARLIEEGAVTVFGTVRSKPSFPIDENTPVSFLEIRRDVHPYVSRGGEKLKAALDSFSLSPAGRVALDIGASSGGFTDCLLRHGASLVYAVDVGHGQLAPCLLEDSRVVSMEHCNARYLKREDFPKPPDFAVMDVSFISATLLFPKIAELLPKGAPFIFLVKPQFEVGRSGLGKGGIVRDEHLRREALCRVLASAESVGFSHLGTIDSPILGGDGNHEFLAAFIKE